MKGKIIGLVVATVITLAVAAILIVLVTQSNKKNHNPNTDPFAKSTKGVASICRPTDYKELCIQSLAPISKNETATPKDYIHVAINATINAIKEGMEKSTGISEGATRAIDKMAFKDCNELLQLAVDELLIALKDVGDSKLHSMNDRVNDLKNWFSAVISYKETCLDGIEQKELKDLMLVNLVDASELTSNLLAITSELGPILNSFGIETNVSFSYRRLLHDLEIDHDRYPNWVSSGDRQLIGRINPHNPLPNVIVAQDGTGHFSTISQALMAYPKNIQGRYVIYVKTGIYNEQVLITKDQVNIFMFGDGPRNTIVTGRKSYRDGVTTYQTATFSVIGNGFVAKSMGFQNSAGPEGHQAVALRVQSDMSVFYDCRMDGYQDTLYTQAHRQFYRNCVISGTVDFIFGDGNAMIQNSLIIVRKPMDGQQNTVTAQGKKDARESTGIVIHNSRIVPEKLLFPLRFKIHTYLGRPWKTYSTTVIMQTLLSDFIQPAGWLEWRGKFALDTLFYAEFGNRGPGGNTKQRVRWKGYHALTNKDDVMRYTIGPFIQGNQWLPHTGTPFVPGLKF